jgi:hypothetical protein
VVLDLNVIEANGHHMNRIPGIKVKRLIFAMAIAAAAFGSVPAPSDAAELWPDGRTGARHVRTAWYYSNWRDRCAWAGYYCLYAWDGYIYHYPWDDRPSAYAYSARRHRYSRLRY